MNNNLLSIRQISKMLDVSVDSLRRWDKSGKLKSHREKKRSMRYYQEAEIEKYFRTTDIYKLALKWAAARKQFEPPQFFYSSNSYIFQARLSAFESLLSGGKEIEPIHSLIVAVAGEIGNNSFDHNLGNWPDIAGVFFGFNFEKKIIVLADRGRGVLATLKRVRPGLKNNRDALRVAFTEIISGRAPESRGNGLKFVRKIIAKNNLKLRFQSGDAELKINKGEANLKIKKSAKSIRGCIALIEY